MGVIIRYCGGMLNASYNCLDIHVKNGFGEQEAIIHDSPLTSVIEKWTYKQLLEQVINLKKQNCLKN
jgi:propionyl-CoA synthetase